MSSQELNVDGIIFQFPTTCIVEAFDEWSQYKKLADILDAKGCDIVAVDDEDLWLIEVKDYTYPGARQPRDLPKIVGQKAIGTLALLNSLARVEADSEATLFARTAAKSKRIRLALHMEFSGSQFESKSKTALLPSLQMKLTQVAKSLAVDRAHITSSTQPHQAPWTTQRDPTRRALHKDR